MGRDAAPRALGSHPVAGDGDFPSGSERRSGLKIPDRGSRESCSGWPGSDARFGWVGGRSQPPPSPGLGFPPAEPGTQYGDFWTEACCKKGFGTLCPQPRFCKSAFPRRGGKGRTVSDPGKAETASGRRCLLPPA